MASETQKLVELQNGEPTTTSLQVAQASGKKQAKAPSSGVYVTVRPGNTYWGWWVKYGTPIQTLRNWNHWPDRRIPIGARARVK
ncbi:LysM peptidoglycan-binding domain-containing protein [Weissella paramesenteroides]|uniref:LysM peptidoglycan-binding domain-containing protein n=1 Tax=Weissella paramesenteroides TaxID=1249 RepID=UPI003982FBAA